MKVAVLGCGSIGRRHIQNIQSLGHDVVAYNRGEERAEAAKNDFGIRVYRDCEALLSEEQPYLSFVCTPNSSHIEHSILCAKYDTHLFIEKPVSHSLDDVKKLCELVKRKQLIVQVGANLRYDFGPRKIYDAVKNGDIGKVKWAGFYGGMHLPDWHPQEDYRQMYSAKKALGGGVVLDFIHEIDLILWFFGRAQEIIGRAYNSGALEIETQDVADMLFLYNDKNVSLHIDYLQKPFQRGMKIIGDRGWCEWSLVQEAVFIHDHKTNETEKINYPVDYNKNDMYVAQLKSFFACLEAGTQPKSNLGSGIDALKAALKVHSHS